MGQADPPKEKQDKPYDPLEAFRGMRDAYLGAMAKSMVVTVNTEAYAQATGEVLDTYLVMTAPAKEALDRSMLQAIEQMSLLSRSDVLGVAERFTNMEMRIDDMDAKLDELLKLAKTKPAPVQAPLAPRSQPQSQKLTRPPATQGRKKKISSPAFQPGRPRNDRRKASPAGLTSATTI